MSKDLTRAIVVGVGVIVGVDLLMTQKFVTDFAGENKTTKDLVRYGSGVLIAYVAMQQLK